ncbi:MAG: hypothetical protein AMK75_04875, partial [Planctomycetes bacterium SM23_65]
MKVTMVGTLPPIKGVSDYCIQQTEVLSRRLDVDFVNFSHIYPERLYPGGTKETDETFQRRDSVRLTVRAYLDWFNPLGWFWTGLTASGDVLHVHWWTFYLAPVMVAICAAAKLRRIPVVMTVHNVLSHESGPLDRLLTRIAFRLPDRFIVHTEENRRQLADIFGVARERTTIIPHGVYTFYDDAAISREDARRELGLSEDERALLYFGHIRDYKGLDVLLHAFDVVRREIPSARLIVAGTCWTDWRSYQRVIDERGLGDRVRLDIGYIESSKVKVYFRGADLMVLPYLHFEAQSGPGNIALAFGVPMVVTATGGLPKLVRDPDAVAPPGDAEKLAQAIVKA